jgi:predicted NACHT family NTPase
MLRLIAYEMQAGDEGLKGNLISSRSPHPPSSLSYLRDQGFSEPREKANRLIQQLRERNFILCYRGADTYGCMHRTFLEYFCAVEIVHRFEKQRTLTFEQLRDEVFGQHWQDETWHEVLRLICGAIDPKFSGELTEFLMNQEIDDSESDLLSQFQVRNLILATQCLSESKNSMSLATTSNRLLKLIKKKIEDDTISRIEFEALIQMAEVVAIVWGEDSDVLSWLQACLNIASDSPSWSSSYFAMIAIVRGWRNSVEILPLLKEVAQREGHSMAAQAAVEVLVKDWKDDPETLLILKRILTQRDENNNARQAAVRELAKHWKDDPDTLSILRNLAQQDDAWIVQSEALRELSAGRKDDPDTLLILKGLAWQHDNLNSRKAALRSIIDFWKDAPEIADFLGQIITNDPFEREKHWEENPRKIALNALLTHHSTHPKTLELLRDHAINDPDEQLREWAQEQLETHDVKIKMEASSNG